MENLSEEKERSIQNIQNACDEYEIRLGADPEGYSKEAQEQARLAIMKEGATCVPEAKAWASTRIKMSLLDWVQYQALRTSCKHCKELPIKNVAKNYVTHHGRGKCLGVVLCTEWLEHNGELDFASRRQKEKEDLGAAIDDYGDCWVAKEPDEKYCPSPPPLPACRVCGIFGIPIKQSGVCHDHVGCENRLRIRAENTPCRVCKRLPKPTDNGVSHICGETFSQMSCETWLENNSKGESGDFVDPEILRLKKMALHDRRIGHPEKAQDRESKELGLLKGRLDNREESGDEITDKRTSGEVLRDTGPGGGSDGGREEQGEGDRGAQGSVCSRVPGEGKAVAPAPRAEALRRARHYLEKWDGDGTVGVSLVVQHLLDWAEQEDRQRVDQDQEIGELSQRVQELDEKWTQEFLDRRKRND